MDTLGDLLATKGHEVIAVQPRHVVTARASEKLREQRAALVTQVGGG